jgi:hypothetical protein
MLFAVHLGFFLNVTLSILQPFDSVTF